MYLDLVGSGTIWSGQIWENGIGSGPDLFNQINLLANFSSIWSISISSLILQIFLWQNLKSFAAVPLWTPGGWSGLKGRIRIRNDLKSRIRIRTKSFRIHTDRTTKKMMQLSPIGIQRFACRREPGGIFHQEWRGGGGRAQFRLQVRALWPGKFAKQYPSISHPDPHWFSSGSESNSNDSDKMNKIIMNLKNFRNAHVPTKGTFYGTCHLLKVRQKKWKLNWSETAKHNQDPDPLGSALILLWMDPDLKCWLKSVRIGNTDFCAWVPFFCYYCISSVLVRYRAAVGMVSVRYLSNSWYIYFLCQLLILLTKRKCSLLSCL